MKAELEALRERVLRLERGSSPVADVRFSIGSPAIDAALGGGLVRGALHEVFAEGMAHEPAAAAFAILLALRASGGKPIVWVRQDFVGLEMGEIHAPGLAELGLSPDRLIMVRARDGPSVLRAGEEAARCPPLGAVLIEPWGNPKTLDLVATRRLAPQAKAQQPNTSALTSEPPQPRPLPPPFPPPPPCPPCPSTRARASVQDRPPAVLLAGGGT